METFTKLFASITDSSIWSEDNETRIVWITMLAMCDQDGYVPASIPGLAARARVSIEAVERAIEKFTSPDRYSRSEEFDGRRIEKADRGWLILNYQRFKDMRDEDARRRYERERKREQRRRDRANTQDVRDNPGQAGTVPESHALSAHADVDTETEKTTTTKNVVRDERDSERLPVDGGGGEALRGEALQGAEPPGDPTGQSDDASVVGRIHSGGMATVGSGGARPMPHGSLERANAAVDDAEAHRRESAEKAMITAGIADPGTRSRIAALPTCTAGLVRRVERLAKEKAKASGATLGGGLLANAIETEARAIVYRQQEEHDAASTMVAGARIRMEAMATEDRERAEARRAEERAIRIENAMYMMAIDALPTERAEAARSELIEANPKLKHLAKYEPRSPYWRGLIVAHLQIDVQPYRLEAEQAVDALPVQGVVEVAASTHGSRQAVGK